MDGSAWVAASCTTAVAVVGGMLFVLWRQQSRRRRAAAALLLSSAPQPNKSSLGGAKNFRRVTSKVINLLRADLSGEASDRMALERIFAAHTSPCGLMREAGFIAACTEDLQLGLAEVELKRIFDAMVDDDAGHPEEEGVLDFAGFKRAVRERFFLERIVRLPRGLRERGSGPLIDIDLGRSTQENYTGAGEQNVGPYKAIRETRDRDYHGTYTAARQMWQDGVIGAVCQRTTPQPKPWLVFTCGAMGSGKGYALGWMSSEGFFPLERIVHIDPDHFKAVMPEWDDYVAHGLKIGRPEHPGNMCHRESCYLQEIATEVALQKEQNVWVDGSLRDTKWFSQVFDDIRTRFTSYRIAILVVEVPPGLVRERARKRAEATGRAIPEKLLEQSLDAVEKSLTVLGPKADLVARIDNSQCVPRLALVSMNNFSGAWAILAQRFARSAPAPSDFPKSLAPLFVLRVRGASLTSPEGLAGAIFDATDHTAHDVAIAVGGVTYKAVATPVVPITLDIETREQTLVPTNAVALKWLYPSETTKDAHWASSRTRMGDAERCLLEVGGFAFYNESHQLVAINAYTPQRQEHLVQFGSVIPWPESRAAQIPTKRWAAVTVPHLCENGAAQFCWVSPNERFEAQRRSPLGALLGSSADATEDDEPYVAPIAGGFAYKMTAQLPDGSPRADRCIFFPILTAHHA